MRREEFKYKVAKNNIPESWFLINNGSQEDTFCLEEVYGKWYFYYYEKGNRENELIFDNVEDALEILYKKLLIEKKYHGTI
ncbi:hypothetical protein [Alkaliflexus imshenetskii]|uniref:hypothetical protein n=1 Tax=Alkaliflexus imshenetskii TaxID=286730 RepID=UPI00047CC90C|nr:hypothetical protein [Alkaliflexus imshenetskii]